MKTIGKHTAQVLLTAVAVVFVCYGAGVSGISFLWVLLAERKPVFSSALKSMDRANAELGGSAAVIFGAYHKNAVQAVYAAVMGIAAAIVYARTRNLFYPIMVHMANNLLGAVQSIFPSDTAAFAVNLFAVFMIVPFSAIILFMRLRRE